MSLSKSFGTIAIPGTFDPVTRGHINLVTAARERFPESALVIIFQFNPTKQKRLITYENSRGLFRLALCDAGISSTQMVVSHSSQEFLGILKHHDITRVVRGVRNSKNVLYESVLGGFIKAAHLMTTQSRLDISVMRSKGLISSTKVRCLLGSECFDRAEMQKLVTPSVAKALTDAHFVYPPFKGRLEFNEALKTILSAWPALYDAPAAPVWHARETVTFSEAGRLEPNR